MGEDLGGRGSQRQGKRMPMTRTTMILAVSLLALGPAEARADELAGLIKNLFDQVTINASTANPANPAANIDHSSHFFLGGENLNVAVRQLNVTLAAQLASFPLASSSGGFTFGLGPRGEVVPTSTTFGPLFAERAVTIGRKQFNFGFTFQGTNYSSFDDQSLKPDSTGLRFISQHNDCCPATGPNNPSNTTDFNPTFERDLLLSTLRATIETKTTAFFANYGVTPRFDVGVAVPIVSVNIDARVDGEILRLGSGDASTTHSFDRATGSRITSRAGSGSATGLGDILLRAKYNLYRTGTTAFAAALDMRVPTGDKDNLLGTGATQAQPFFVASGEYGRLSPHVNFGYTFSSGETSAAAVRNDTPQTLTNNGNPVPNVTLKQPDLSVPDEVNYTVGFNVAATPKVTLGFDLRGRTIRGVPRFASQDTSYLNRGTGALPQPTFTARGEFALEPTKGNDNQVLGVVGGKINLRGTFLLNLSVLFAMTGDGLKPKPTPVVGFDYVF
jgi:outer membrane putative beta-barrel porin/alpha-amylase